jgi:FlaG/FlaF family flagellin (archaellin)
MMSRRGNTFSSDISAVSELVGDMLMTAIAVLAFSVIAVSLFSYADSREVVYADIQGWVSPDSDTVHLRHAGGQTIDVPDTRILLNINGTVRELPPSGLAGLKGSSTWQPGETISMNVSGLWGDEITPVTSISATIVDMNTNLVIMSGNLASHPVHMEEGTGI